MKRSKLPQLLRATREASETTLTELAKRVRASPGYLSRIERGDRQRQPSEKLLTKLADALGLERDAVLIAAGRIPRDVHTYLVTSSGAIPRVREMMRKAA